MTITLDDAKDAGTGEGLYKYEMILTREVRETGEITVITATPPERVESVMDEIWEKASDCGDLEPDGIFDKDHEEEILSVIPFTKRCAKTAEMELVGGGREKEVGNG